VIINYASYMRRDDDVVLSGLTASATNEFFEVALGGLITVTAAVVFLGATLTSASTGSSFSLGFQTLPVVFAHMPWGNFFGAIFFFMLFLAAITSSLSMLQPTLAFFQEALGLQRKAATLLLSAVAVAGNLFVLWFSSGLAALDTLDFWVGSFMIFIVAGTQLICFGWVVGADAGIAELRLGARIPVPRIFRFVIRYVSPAYLLIIFLGFCYYNIPTYVGAILGDPAAGVPPNRGALMAWGVILACIAGLFALTALGARRWRAQGLDLDGRLPVAAAAPGPGGEGSQP
jgi:SNF family Na+-dependent transporter